MMCEGIGNVLSSTALPIPDNLQLAIIKPEISVSTAQAYSKVIPGVPATPLNEIIENTPFELWQGRVKNDFETSVFLQFPEIEFIKTTLLDLGAILRLRIFRHPRCPPRTSDRLPHFHHLLCAL